ncbi:hypothetical protein BCR41DRAFT_397908 [Lobosporangium transversale]|uniref:Uncharacterized protein n=1 Tax=Lobosporangium transversale TaxID=64571 RepID=A0A1Y2GMN8_9FUNG|nr:hypothetical protein BCR41DRAFT_397908 [Lobosporangium transversale]ORZ11766.1 hypothetical protein BCR41DRAFT_397908 [Lobosporangium transversale]|eukprot:XP_021879863.1 hypothetical protein BCR41DRAFT_397908 [Lobosporangium transversale]
MALGWLPLEPTSPGSKRYIAALFAYRSSNNSYCRRCSSRIRWWRTISKPIKPISQSHQHASNDASTTGSVDQLLVVFMVYYGFYNAIGLLLITKIFNIYSLNWWPKALGGLTSYFIFWLSTQLMGILVYYFTGLESYRLTWVFLTFCTMTMPLLIAFLVIRSENRNVYRHSLTMAQKTFLSASSIESRIPASYIRFLWFCVALAIALSTIVTGEMYADQFQAPRTTPHTTIEDWCMCIRGTYEEYKRQVGRGLFLRNLAENVTMLAFLLWKVDGTPCHKGGPQDFKEYPELIVVFILVMIHILQDMLLSLLDLNFA